MDTGWTFYTPLSSNYAQGHVVAVVVGIFISGFSTIATGVNFIITIHRLRAPGLTWYRLPVFIWSLYSTSIIFVLATPVLAITLLLLLFETGCSTSASSTPASVAIRCCSSICSGSTRIPPSTS